MKISVMLLMGLSLCALAACNPVKTQKETWQNKWTIVVNAVEKNPDQPGHHPMGWIPGELGTDYVNRPHFDGAGTRTGLLALHPLSKQEPAIIVYSGKVLLEKPVLTVEASGNVNGDCLLQCVVNQQVLGEVELDGSKWQIAEFDLSGFIGKPIALELRIAGGGKKPWHFEHGYIDHIYFKPTSETPK